jgi:hypothetical protein
MFVKLMRLTSFLCSVVLLSIGPAGDRALAAPSLSLTPGYKEFGGFTPFFIALRISGLDAAGPVSLSSFSVDIKYNPAFIFPGGVIRDNDYLGVVETDSTIADSGTPGVLHLEQVSLLSSAALDALQPDEWDLAFIKFGPVQTGLSEVRITNVELRDVFGALINNPATANAAVRFVSEISEPSAALLLAFGLYGIGLADGRRRRSRHPGR